MRISGQPNISVTESRQLRQVTTTKRGDKRATDVNILSDTLLFNAICEPHNSISLSPGDTDFYFYPVVPANKERTILSGVFTSSVYWKVELIIDAVSIYTIIGNPFDTIPINFKGFDLPTGETLIIKFTNMSSNALQVGTIYATLSHSDSEI